MLKFLHTADWHLGSNRNSVVSENMLNEVARLAEENNVDFVLCVGDIFDHSNVKQKDLDFLIDFLIKHNHIQFIFTVGNHDYKTKERKEHSLSTLKILEGSVKNIVVLDRYESYQLCINDKCFEIVSVEKFNSTCKNRHAIPRIVTLHAPMSDNAMDESSWKDNVQEMLIRTEADYIALGDIHKHMKLHTRCWYPGPPCQKTYSDESGLVLVEFDSKTDKIDTTSLQVKLPKKITIDFIWKDGKNSEESFIQEFTNNFELRGNLVKVKFSVPLKVWAGINKEKIKSSLRGMFLELKLENNPPEDKKTKSIVKKISNAKTVHEEIGILIDENDYDLDKTELKNLCLEYLA